MGQTELDIDLAKVSDQAIKDKIKDAVETMTDRREAKNSEIPGFEDLIWGKDGEEHEAVGDRP